MSRPLYERVRAVEKREWLALAALVAIVWVCFFFRLGGVPFLGKDEPRYAEVAREMLVTGDWITPRLAGHTWFEKPALPYWAMAAGYAVLGVSEGAARFGMALMAALAVAVVYLAARRAAGPKRAAVAAAVLATSALWFAFARGASFDMPLSATMAAALGCVYAWDTAKTARARLAWAAGAGAWAGASMLAKGLAGPLLLGMIVAAYALVAGSWRRVRAGDVALAALACAAVAGVWYGPVWSVNGDVFIQEFFVDHHFKRYLTNRFHHPQPVWFYPVIVLAGLLPWSFFLLGGLRSLAGVLKRRPVTDDERLVWLAAVWVAVPVIFFSFSTSKLPGYILPVFPGLALLVAWAIERGEEEARGRWAYPLAALTVAGLGVGLAIYAADKLAAPAWEVVAVATPLLVAAAAVAVAWWRGRRPAAVWTVAASGAAVVAVIASLLFAEVGHRESLADLSRVAAQALRPGEQVMMLGVVEYAPAFYAGGRIVVDERGEILIADSYDQLAAAVEASPARSVVCITDRLRAGELSRGGRFDVEPLGDQRDRVLVRVTAAARARRASSAPGRIPGPA
jgi:4-amino-4-deoxy-L-arabinose transferase-like glycosyltransferase